MAKFYKVYEIEDNVEYKLENYPTYFVGAFTSKEKAENFCNCIDISNCNSTTIEFGEITPQDIKDIYEHGFQGGNGEALQEIVKLIEQHLKSNNQNNEELIK